MNLLSRFSSVVFQQEREILPTVDFDAAMAGIDLNVATMIYLPAGIYLTNGFYMPRTGFIKGVGMGQSIIRLKPNANAAPNFPHVRMVNANTQDKWSDFFGMSDVTIDGNIENQEAFENGNYKNEPIVVQAVLANLERVEVVGFGSNGNDYVKDGQPVGSGLEAFPIALHTFANGDPALYFDWVKERPDLMAQPASFLRISRCRVSHGRYKGAGYCTGHMLVTNHLGDRQPVGTRTTLAGLVQNNYAEVGHAIGYGCAGSEMIRYEGNVSAKTKCGFNADTGSVSRVELVNNRFMDVAQGVSLQASGRANKISGNIFVMGSPVKNPVNGATEPFYGVHTKFQNDPTTVDSNTYVVGAEPFTEPVGVLETNARVLRIGGEDRTAEIDELKLRIETLRVACDKFQARSLVLESGIKAFDENSRVAKTAREILVGLVN